MNYIKQILELEDKIRVGAILSLALSVLVLGLVMALTDHNHAKRAGTHEHATYSGR